jgi:hypothetical protein
MSEFSRNNQQNFSLGFIVFSGFPHFTKLVPGELTVTPGGISQVNNAVRTDTTNDGKMIFPAIFKVGNSRNFKLL